MLLHARVLFWYFSSYAALIACGREVLRRSSARDSEAYCTYVLYSTTTFILWWSERRVRVLHKSTTYCIIVHSIQCTVLLYNIQYSTVLYTTLRIIPQKNSYRFCDTTCVVFSFGYSTRQNWIQVQPQQPWRLLGRFNFFPLKKAVHNKNSDFKTPRIKKGE